MALDIATSRFDDFLVLEVLEPRTSSSHQTRTLEQKSRQIREHPAKIWEHIINGNLGTIFRKFWNVCEPTFFEMSSLFVLFNSEMLIF